MLRSLIKKHKIPKNIFARYTHTQKRQQIHDRMKE